MYYYEHGTGDSKKEIVVLGNGKFESKSLNSLGGCNPNDHYCSTDHTTVHTTDHTTGCTTDNATDHATDRAADHATEATDDDHAHKIFVRIHSSCITSEVFSSTRCDCAQQLQESLQIIGRDGGLVIYLDQEGRDIGLLNKLKAYNLIDQGWDTVTANLELGFKEDERDYQTAALILKDLGIDHIYLMTNNPQKVLQMQEYGITVLKRIPILCGGLEELGVKDGRDPETEMEEYFMTKVCKMGHLL
jgi:3,4-dihydroxy 2-butanone 4-phosphate synthase/GTP cyclohydrolase II